MYRALESVTDEKSNLSNIPTSNPVPDEKFTSSGGNNKSFVDGTIFLVIIGASAVLIFCGIIFVGYCLYRKSSPF